MSLLKKIERRDYSGGTFSNPLGLPPGAIPTNAQSAYIDGTAGAGYPMSTNTAMRHATVFACVRIISDLIASLPVDLYKGDETPVEPLPTKLIQPSVYATKTEWVWQVMASLLLRGNAYGMIAATDRLEYPTAVDIIAPDHVCVEKDKTTGKKIFKIGPQTLTTDQVWHLPGPQLPGELEGMSPIRYASRTIGIGLDAEQFGSDFFRNGINPTATLETDQQVNSEQAAEIKARVKNSMASHDMIVLGAGMKLNPWQLSAEDSQFVDTMSANGITVAQIFGVPPEMLGIAHHGGSVTYANREQRAQDFLNTAINPWLGRLEEALSAWFPRGTYVKFNTGALLRSDLITRYESYQIGIRNNLLLPSEARALEDLPELPGLDDKPLPAPSTSGAPMGSDKQ
jgi:HK97 family phage portal protein